jgi:hypothetical protein
MYLTARCRYPEAKIVGAKIAEMKLQAADALPNKKVEEILHDFKRTNQ